MLKIKSAIKTTIRHTNRQQSEGCYETSLMLLWLSRWCLNVYAVMKIKTGTNNNIKSIKLKSILAKQLNELKIQ